MSALFIMKTLLHHQKIFSALLLWLVVFQVVAEGQEPVTVTVNGVTAIAETDDNFVCATLDWWPPNKCNYNQCPWGRASVLNLNLENPILQKAIKAFNPLRIRIGGSLQDQVVYQIGEHGRQCPTFRKTNDGLFGFSRGCLPMKRWDEVNHLFNETGVIVTFGLNALAGRQKTSDGLWNGPWDSSNARDFVQYTVLKGYNVDSWEFGNELSGSGVAARVDAKQYAQDLITLKSFLNDLYQNSSTLPLVIAPGGFFDQQWYSQLLENSGPGVLDVLTHHIYNLGAGVDPGLKSKILNPFFLSEIAQTFKDLQQTIQEFGPWSSAWVGESGGAYNSGGRLVSNTFINSFWYLDQLGIALLWHRLMGNKVLKTTIDGSAYLRAYTHCAKDTTGITLLLINLSNTTTFHITVRDDVNLVPIEVSAESPQREEYKLRPEDGNLVSQTMLLNGRPLELTEDGDIPPLQPTIVDGNKPIAIDPLSIAFFTLEDFQAPACA
ncbi:Heparanase-like protein 2 [Nymphaea thermarum]|nr:Heparanase-like protein 2 [Nymphaea thermarum]